MGDRVYFRGLNGVRFLAALMVIIHHIEQFKGIYQFSSLWENNSIRALGGIGVTLFFTLSGFLITYLLLKEKEIASTISIPKFYVRRILRIWPLYYLVLLLAFFVFPNFPFLYPSQPPDFNGTQFFLFTALMANMAIVLFPPFEFASQLWSVGVEEQFYLIWPHLVKRFKNILPVLLFIVIALFLVRYFFITKHLSDPDSSKYAFVFEFLKYFRIDCMAIGGIASWIVFTQQKNVLSILYAKWLQLLVYFIIVICLVTGFKFYWLGLNDVFYAILFSIAIINVATNSSSVLNFENKIMFFFGKISYGLYMYHPICIAIALFFIKWLLGNTPNSVVFNLLVYFLSIGITIFTSWLSYEYIERLFLKFKNKYTVIESNRPENN